MPPQIRVVDWNGPEAVAYVRKRTVKWITVACLAVERRAKVLLSVAGTGQGKGKNRVYGANPSKPGEPPRKQTGRLRASVTHEVDPDRLTGRVGTNVEYGRHLELGTRRGLLPRPWLRRAFAESMGEIRAALGRVGGP
jgi:phage gpG-like protein